MLLTLAWLNSACSGRRDKTVRHGSCEIVLQHLSEKSWTKGKSMWKTKAICRRRRRRLSWNCLLITFAFSTSCFRVIPVVSLVSSMIDHKLKHHIPLYSSSLYKNVCACVLPKFMNLPSAASVFIIISFFFFFFFLATAVLNMAIVIWIVCVCVCVQEQERGDIQSFCILTARAFICLCRSASAGAPDGKRSRYTTCVVCPSRHTRLRAPWAAEAGHWPCRTRTVPYGAKSKGEKRRRRPHNSSARVLYINRQLY